jgi:hypothetical protein
MPLQKLQLRPGIIKDLTGYTNEGGWRVSNLVRFRLGLPESIGGWENYGINGTFQGSCRSMLSWLTLSGQELMGFGTNLKYYIERGGGLYDVTPLRSVVSLTDPFAATDGSSVILVTDVAHGCVDGDFVTFSGATSLGGNVTAPVLNTEFQISFVDSDSYNITVPVTANASDVGGGGSVTASYQINVGLDTQTGGVGWGAGPWGFGGWGEPVDVSALNTLRLWSEDAYGEDLIYNVRDGGIYYWAVDTVTFPRGVTLASLSTDPSCPTIGLQVLVSDRDRHVLVFGANQGGSTIPDPLSVRFSSQEDPFAWTPTATNTAGEIRFGSGSQVIAAVETKREIVVFTDTSLYSLQFIGPPYTFGSEQLASNITIAGFNSAVAVDDIVFWMGRSQFYVYAGRTDALICPLNNYVFENFNDAQSDKVFAASNSEFNEVTWFYPSANSPDNDLYVTYNYSEKVWTHGSLARTAWMDRGLKQYPVAASPDHNLYFHEIGTDDGSTEPATPLNAYVESSPITIAQGDKFSFVRRILPDVNFFDSTNSPQLDMILQTQNYPGSNYAPGSDSAVVRTAIVPVEQYTQVKDIRLRGRSLVLRVESNKLGTRWGLGSPRIEVRTDGGR